MASFPSQSSAPGRLRQLTPQNSNNTVSDTTIHTQRNEDRRGDETEEEEEKAVETVFADTRTPSNMKWFSDDEDWITDDSKQSSKSVSQINAAIPPSHTTPAEEEEEPRKCWICYTDESEDSPLNKEWRSPCPCALNAHEACLLDWLADMENPQTRKDNGREARMLCPQCKSEIVISRPRSLMVDFVRAVEQVAGRLVLPGMAFTLAGTVWAGCCAHGVYSMYFIFGKEDAQQILDGATQGWSPQLNLGLPLIPLALIFSRTRYAEGLLPAIPIIFFATHHPYNQELDLEMWPPSAAVTFAALPYARSFYRLLYDRLLGGIERRWIAEVQPRAGEDEGREADGGAGEVAQPEAGEGQVAPNNDQDQDHANGQDEDNGEVLMEIELQVGIGNENQHPGGQQAGGGGGAQNQAGNQPNNNILGRRQDDIIHETSTLADTILGALLFPAISASMGGALKLVLPKSWTTASVPGDKGRSGLLQSRWGRSVVGGCVFVLLKDAIIFYCRWKLAQSHRKRKVLNYDRKKKRVVEP